MKKFLFPAIAAAILFIPFGCSEDSDPAGPGGSNNNNTTTFVNAGVDAELLGAWDIYNEVLDTVIVDMGWVFSSDNITCNGSSILADGSKPVANNGNIGYAMSTMTGYAFDYSLSPNKDSLYIIAENSATGHVVTREAALDESGVGVYVKKK